MSSRATPTATGPRTSARVELFEGSPSEWDDFALGQDGCSPFHLRGWGEVVRRTFGHPTPSLAARDVDGGLVGVLPLVRVRSHLFGDYLVSTPFASYGGPLGSPEAAEALVARAVAEADETGVDLLELRSRSELPVSLPASHRKITVVLPLPVDGDPETLWAALDSKVRNQVRRPRKEGVEVRFGHELLDDFHRVYTRHMRDLGTPAQPLRLFEAAAEIYGSDLWVGCAYLEGRPVAVGCGFRRAEEFEITWAADLIEHRRIASNMLLYWSFLERAVAEGLSRFNFGRCTPGSGTHRFKRQWGGEDERLWWYQHAPGEGEPPDTPSPDDDRWAWAPRVWRRLPLAVTRRLGPRLVRSLP